MAVTQQMVMQAMQRARALGQPVVVPGGEGIVALPSGQTRMGTPMELQQAGVPSFARPGASAFNAPTIFNTPNPFVPTAGPGVPAGTPTPAPVAAPGGFTPSPFGDLSLNVGTPIPGTQYNPATAATPSIVLPPQTITATRLPPDPATAARNYRLTHGLGTAQDRMTTDQLNAMSLAAAQAGRTYWPPGTVVGPGQYAPNLLQAPPAAVAANTNALQPDNLHWWASQTPAQSPTSGGM